MRLLTVGLACLLWAVAANVGTAQQGVVNGTSAAGVTESELTRTEKELAQRLVDLEKATEAEKTQRDAVEQARKALEQAKEAGKTGSGLEEIQAALKQAEESLRHASEERRTLQTLHDQVAEKFRIAQENAKLAAKKIESPPAAEPAKTPLDDVFEKKNRVDQAKQEANLAQKKTRTLREHLETLLTRQNAIRKASDEITRRLDSDESVSYADRLKLVDDRQALYKQSREVNDEIQKAREEILLAQATQRIKEQIAQEETVAYVRWRNDFMLSGGLFGAALVLVLVIRLGVARQIADPQRRYYINKLFSLVTAVVVIAGLGLIFADKFANLLTLFGLAVAGVTISLQEIVASFAAWFFIRGPRGYRTGDWIQIGDQCGEVADIGFIRTTLQQVDTLATDGGSRGGNLTGGLTVIMNNTILKQPLVNYTRGYPFVWCSLSYTVTYESDWELARELLLQAVGDEMEIKSTAERALDKLRKMAGEYSIRVDSTEPVVRTWAAPNGVELTLRFLAHPRRRAALMDKINAKVLRAVQAVGNIDFAYQTVRSIPTPPADKTALARKEVA